jgi:hypothetical protein
LAESFGKLEGWLSMVNVVGRPTLREVVRDVVDARFEPRSLDQDFDTAWRIASTLLPEGDSGCNAPSMVKAQDGEIGG